MTISTQRTVVSGRVLVMRAFLIVVTFTVHHIVDAWSIVGRVGECCRRRGGRSRDGCCWTPKRQLPSLFAATSEENMDLESLKLQLSEYLEVRKKAGADKRAKE